MRSRLYSVISVFLFFILYCYTAVGVVVVMILAAFRLRKPVDTLTRLWAKSVFLIIGKRFKVSGLENIRKEEKYILVANHASLFDIVAIMSFYPGISWFGHERLLKVPVFGLFLKMTDYVPFREPNYRNTRNMIEQLVSKSNERTVAIFPEGTRTLNGKLNAFYRGFIYLYRCRNHPILPVTLNGFYALKPKNRLYINFRSKLDITVHEAIRKEDLEAKSDTEIIDAVKSIINSAYRSN